jgi:hypothetical protein
MFPVGPKRTCRLRAPMSAFQIALRVHIGAGITFHNGRICSDDGSVRGWPLSWASRLTRTCCGSGFALANKGHDTRALQPYLGHKNIQHTVRYTELSPDRLKDFWR